MLQIEVSNRGGEITARIDVQSASARQAVLENLSSLQKALASQGTVIDRIEVNLHDFTREEGAADSSDPHDDRPQPENQRNQNGETGREETEQQSSTDQSQSDVDQLDIQI